MNNYVDTNAQLVHRYTKASQRYSGLLRVYLKRCTWFFINDGTAFIKRVIDVLVAISMLIALSPLFLLIMGVIYLGSPGPVFYRQKRMGLR